MESRSQPYQLSPSCKSSTDRTDPAILPSSRRSPAYRPDKTASPCQTKVGSPAYRPARPTSRGSRVYRPVGCSSPCFCQKVMNKCTVKSFFVFSLFSTDREKYPQGVDKNVGCFFRIRKLKLRRDQEAARFLLDSAVHRCSKGEARP